MAVDCSRFLAVQALLALKCLETNAIVSRRVPTYRNRSSHRAVGSVEGASDPSEAALVDDRARSAVRSVRSLPGEGTSNAASSRDVLSVPHVATMGRAVVVAPAI